MECLWLEKVIPTNAQKNFIQIENDGQLVLSEVTEILRTDNHYIAESTIECPKCSRPLKHFDGRIGYCVMHRWISPLGLSYEAETRERNRIYEIEYQRVREEKARLKEQEKACFHRDKLSALSIIHNISSKVSPLLSRRKRNNSIVTTDSRHQNIERIDQIHFSALSNQTIKHIGYYVLRSKRSMFRIRSSK